MFKGIVRFTWLLLSLSFGQTATANTFISSVDTIKLELNQGFFDGSDVEVPVLIQTSSAVYAIDLAIRFNTDRILFDTLTNVLTGLQYLYYLNPNDSIWRITSYHPNGIQPGTVVFNLRFATTNNEVCAYDFSDTEAFVNGDLSVGHVTGCMDNLSIHALDALGFPHVFPNPFQNQLFIGSDTSVIVQIYDGRGELVLEATNPSAIDTGSWHAGMYYVRIIGDRNHYTYKVFKLFP